MPEHSSHRVLCAISACPPLLTLVFQEVAHACAPGQDSLSDILDDLGLIFGNEGSEPFCKALSKYC